MQSAQHPRRARCLRNYTVRANRLRRRNIWPLGKFDRDDDEDSPDLICTSAARTTGMFMAYSSEVMIFLFIDNSYALQHNK